MYRICVFVFGLVFMGCVTVSSALPAMDAYFEPAVPTEAEVAKIRTAREIMPSASDEVRVAVLGIDIQPTFVFADGELPVAGAVQDTERLARFIDEHMGEITTLFFTLDTHTEAQIFHPLFWVDAEGNNPDPYTIITVEDLENGVWSVNPAMTEVVGKEEAWLNDYALHYAQTLAEEGKYDLTVWPYHGIEGAPSHQLVPGLAEVAALHGAVRETAPRFVFKGQHPLTENYSAFRPEVSVDHEGGTLGDELTKTDLMEELLAYDKVIIAGQAKSHCVASSIDDLLRYIESTDPALAEKVYLLEDATSPVVTPVVDYTEEANAHYARFVAAGMHRVKTTTPMSEWPQ